MELVYPASFPVMRSDLAWNEFVHLVLHVMFPDDFGAQVGAGSGLLVEECFSHSEVCRDVVYRLHAVNCELYLVSSGSEFH